MTHSDEPQAVVPIVAAAAMLTTGAAAHHALLGVACALVVFLGLWLRRQPGRRRIGSALFLAGALVFATGMLFGTGYSLGKDMAIRDVAPAHG